MSLGKDSTTDTFTLKNVRTCTTLFKKDTTIAFFPENTLSIKEFCHRHFAHWKCLNRGH